MPRKNRIGRNTHRLADIGLSVKPKPCKCEYCRVSAVGYTKFGPIGGPIFAFRDTQLPHSDQVRIREIYGLNVLRMSRNSYVVCAQWMGEDDSLSEYLRSVINVEPVVLTCES